MSVALRIESRKAYRDIQAIDPSLSARNEHPGWYYSLLVYHQYVDFVVTLNLL
jgi:hypothetical protein